MRSIANIVTEAMERYPNVGLVSDSTIARTIKDIEEKIYQFVGKEYAYEVNNVTTDEDYYEMPSDFRYDNLIKAMYYTDIGTNLIPRIVDSKEDLEKMKEPKDQVWRTVEALCLQRGANENTTMYVVYRQKPLDVSVDSSDWDTEYPVIEDEYTDIIVYGLVMELSNFGDAPDITIHNNYQRLYNTTLAKAKADMNARTRRNRKNRIDYKDCW